MKKKLSNWLGQIVCSLLRIVPIKNNYIFFESFTGKNYGGNPKYIYEELLREKGDTYKYIWSMTDELAVLPGNPIIVKRPSLKYLYYAMISKYWVSNVRLPKILIKRAENIYLQTWHGTPLKRIGLDISDVCIAGTDTQKYKEELRAAVVKWDYLIAPNTFSERVFKTAFDFKNKILLTGYPRNDSLLSKNSSSSKNSLKKKLGIVKNKKVILYAPTWRDDQNDGIKKYKFNFPLELKKLKDQLSRDYVILIRCHYIISSNLNLSGVEDFVYDVSDYDEISDLYQISDILITDYSSVMFDYANTDKSILFYTYDLENYRDTLRGFYFDFESEAPGPLLKSESELVTAIKNNDTVRAKYREKYAAFKSRYCHLEDGGASSRVVKAVWGVEHENG